MRKFTAFILLLMVSAISLRAEIPTGHIKGTIKTNDGQLAPFVSVQIKDKNRGVITDEKGVFNFRRIAPGQYTLLVSLLGYETAEQQVTVTANETTTVNIEIKISNTQLQEVIIKGNQNKFGRKESDQVARLPIKNIENPQVYNVIGKELMKEQVITTFDDAVKNAPGVSRLWSSTGRPGDGAGYFSIRGFAVQPTMINGIAGLTNGSIDPANVERIETIKGPSSTLFGSSLISFGGLINIVTKRPYENFGGEISYTGGGFGLSRITADINTPLNDDKTALLRFNGAYHSENSFQDAGFRKSFFLAPSLSYKVSDKLSFLVNAEIYNGEGTNPLMVFLNRSRPLKATTPKELNMDFNRSYTANDITNKTPTVNIYGQANYKLSDKWTSQTNLSRSVRKSEGYYSYVMFLDQGLPAGQPVVQNDTLISRFVYNQNSISTTTGVQQNFIGDFKIGKMRNRVVFGLDYLSQQTTNNNSPYLTFDYVNVTNAKDPRYGQLNRPAVDAKLAAIVGGKQMNSTTNDTYSAYVSDVLNITEKFIAMASVRVDYFDNKGANDHLTGVKGAGKYDQLAVSPKFGLVYQIVKDKIGIFANYMNGFKNLAPVVQPPQLNLDGVLKPQQANQFEGGIKLDALDHRLNFTASYYDLLVTNMTRGAVMRVENVDYNYTIQDGSQRSKGVELDLAANPVNGLNIVAGYSYNDSKMEKSAVFVLGRRPVTAGPEHLANLWISYTITGGKAQGLGAGVGGNYASDNKITNDSRTGVFTLPSYAILNASVFYNAKAFRLALKLDNATNKEYFGGWTTVEKQMPRRLAASATFKF
ncbi:TonB-dependent receptor [Chitinophaga niabensis]|uniref:Iron complex outermembrane recepter protein n=1 Tax=Chitinophaga niabensis TaxID=536979 RepID=A0A1N6GYV8_9BACT|nr:TonB-dependent receptor [Chitinophaga niabensis]SIO12758.1 iron complex outermembrane recepter protein [Chitinophaga niabensis]